MPGSAGSDSGRLEGSAGGESSESAGGCFDRSVSNTWGAGERETLEPIECGLPQPCDAVAVYPEADVPFCLGPFDVEDFGIPDYDEVGATCILEALKAGTPAVHEVARCPRGQFSGGVSLQVLGDGTVIWSHGSFADLNIDQRETWRSMPSADDLDACDVSTPEGLWSCVMSIAETECQSGEPVCPALD